MDGYEMRLAKEGWDDICRCDDLLLVGKERPSLTFPRESTGQEA